MLQTMTQFRFICCLHFHLFSAEIEALKRQTHVAAEESVDFGGGVKGQDRSRATSKDIRQLENKVIK